MNTLDQNSFSTLKTDIQETISKAPKTIVEANMGESPFPRDDLDSLNRVLYWVKIEMKYRKEAVKAFKANDYKEGDVIVFWNNSGYGSMSQGTIAKVSRPNGKTVNVVGGERGAGTFGKTFAVNKKDITGFIKRA